MLNGHVLRKEGKHKIFDNIEFWAEEGLIFIEDRSSGDCNVVTCKDFVKRAVVIHDEAKRAWFKDDRDRLNDCVINMYEVWKEAKTQGDPSDPKIALQKLKERRKVSLITGI